MRIIDININEFLSGINESVPDLQSIAQQALDDVTNEVYEAWRSQAQTHLKSTRNNYINGLQIYQEGPLKNVIVLTGDFNNSIESGMTAFDMKEHFRKSGKVRYSKDGSWYLIIPFRFATPGALGENEAFSSVMPKQIYDLAKKLNPVKSDSSGMDKQGDTLIDIPSSLNEQKIRASFTDMMTKKTYPQYQHKSSIYKGIQKQQKTYEKGSSSQYNSFRTASAKSDPNSWIHRGIAAYNLADKAVESVDVGAIVDFSIQRGLK